MPTSALDLVSVDEEEDQQNVLQENLSFDYDHNQMKIMMIIIETRKVILVRLLKWH